MEWGIIMVLLAWVGYLLLRGMRLQDDLRFEKMWGKIYENRYRELVDTVTRQ